MNQAFLWSYPLLQSLAYMNMYVCKERHQYQCHQWKFSYNDTFIGVDFMTSNQLQYWRNQEDKRHNLESERELNRSNLINELIKSGELGVKQGELAVSEKEHLRKNADTITNVISAVLDQFGLSPMSASKIGANAGTAAKGVGSILGAVLGA